MNKKIERQTGLIVAAYIGGKTYEIAHAEIRVPVTITAGPTVKMDGPRYWSKIADELEDVARQLREVGK